MSSMDFFGVFEGDASSELSSCSASCAFQNELDLALFGSATIVGKPVAEVTVEKPMLETRGLLA